MLSCQDLCENDYFDLKIRGEGDTSENVYSVERQQEGSLCVYNSRIIRTVNGLIF